MITMRVTMHLFAAGGELVAGINLVKILLSHNTNLNRADTSKHLVLIK